MRRYLIKYEDYSGDCDCQEVFGYSEAHAKSQINYKIFYWIKRI